MKPNLNTRKLDLDRSNLYLAADRLPTPATIGVFFESTIPLEEFGGIFCWFGSLDELKVFLASTMLGPHHDGAIPGLYEALLSRTSSDILRSLSLMDSVDDFTAAALDHLNGLLPHRQIAWIGRFGDLATGGGPFERMVRSAYLVETGELDENVDPFGSAPDFVDAVDLADLGERDRFVEYLRGFGS